MQQHTMVRNQGDRATAGAPGRRGEAVLRWATVLFVAAFLFHNADHLRRGVGSISDYVVGAGSVFALISLVAVVLVVLRHRLAPAVAVATGFGGALGVTASHLLPHWSVFSDSFEDGVDALTWAAGVSEIAALLVFGAAGLYVMRLRSRSA